MAENDVANKADYVEALFVQDNFEESIEGF